MNGYILTGGRSTRMGQPKPEIAFGESTFLDRIMDAARPVFDRVTIVSRADEPPHEDVAPIFGVAAALADAGEGRAFVIAADYPLITTELLRFLCERAARSAAPVVAPEWDHNVQMLCAAYDASLAPLIATRIADRRYDLHGLIAEAGGEIIRESDIRSRFAGEPLMNVNTPEQLEAARRLL